LESTAPGTSGTPGIGVLRHGGAMSCTKGVLLISGKLGQSETPNHVSDCGSFRWKQPWAAVASPSAPW
jgi:hypothetical protein